MSSPLSNVDSFDMTDMVSALRKCGAQSGDANDWTWLCTHNCFIEEAFVLLFTPLPSTTAGATLTKACVDASPHLFIDTSRRAIIDRTACALRQRGQGWNTLLLGQRAIGKTHLLTALVAAINGGTSKTRALYMDCSTVIADMLAEKIGFGTWLACMLGWDLTFPGLPSTTFTVVDAYLETHGITLMLVVDEVDQAYKCVSGATILTFLLSANNKLSNHNVRFIVSGSAAVTRGLVFQEVSPLVELSKFPMYHYVGSFNSRKCRPFRLTAPTTLYEFNRTVLPACIAHVSSLIGLAANGAPGDGDISRRDHDDGSGGGGAGAVVDGESVEWGGGLEIPEELVLELYYETRGQVDRVNSLLAVALLPDSVRSVGTDNAVLLAAARADESDLITPDMIPHFCALLSTAKPEYLAAAPALLTSRAPPVLHKHTLEQHAAALRVPNDGALLRTVMTLCDKGVLLLDDHAPDRVLVGFAHPADVVRTAIYYDNGKSEILSIHARVWQGI